MRRQRTILCFLWAALAALFIERARWLLNREHPWVPMDYPRSRAWTPKECHDYILGEPL
jgi:hypothetical protein